MTAIAWVAGTPLEESEVDLREAAVRSSPARAALPAKDSSEGRQLRRWLVQLMAAERIVASHGATCAAPPLEELAKDNAALLELGSVAAALLAQNPLARAVFREVTDQVRIPPERVAAYHAANPEQFTIPERRRVRHAIMASPNEKPHFHTRTVNRGELAGTLEQRVFGARVGETVGPVKDPLGWHVVTVEAIEPAGQRPIEEAEARLLAVARRRAFTAWLDGRVAELVRLAPGYEHPGDPNQPDNTHRH
jgi:[acyl-carrier-protein] S-malonyltransferase